MFDDSCFFRYHLIRSWINNLGFAFVFAEFSAEVMKMNTRMKAFTAVIVAVSMLCVPMVASLHQSSDASDGKFTENDAKRLFDEFLPVTVDEFDKGIGEEYGITYEEYAYAMSMVMGRTLSITCVDGELRAELSEPTRAGHFGAELSGHYLYIYLDSVSVSMILTGSGMVIGAAIGALLGSVFPGLGTLAGGAVGSVILGIIEA